MSRQDGFDRGLRTRTAVLGVDWVTRATSGATAFDARFQDFITRYVWDEVWGDTTLDHETRRLLVLATTLALGRWEEFDLHFVAALDHGLSVDKLRAVIEQSAVYAGVPGANTAFAHARRLLAQHNLGPPSAPLTDQARVRTFSTFSAPQLRVSLQGPQSGPPVVLSHALGLDMTMWDGVARSLGDAGYAVLRYDQRGHGGSPHSPHDFVMNDLVDDAARLVREWGKGPVHFVGLSLGGMVGQGLAARCPELVTSLIVSNSTARYDDSARAAWSERIRVVATHGMVAVADTLVQRYLGPEFRAGHPAEAERLKSRLQALDPQAYVQCARAVRDVDWTHCLHRVAVPTLVVCGAQDRAATVEDAQTIARLVPRAQLALLPGAAHLPTIETPAAFEAQALAFLAGVVGERERGQDGFAATL